MTKYANSFWSPDYISGIDRLSRQSVLSVGQLHELRKFIFGYMKHFHSSGEYLSNLADISYPIDSGFRNARGQKTDRKISGYRQISRSNQQPEKTSDFDMDYVFRQFVNRTRQDSRLHQIAASEIDQILDKVTHFIKHHEPQVKKLLEDMSESFEEYIHAYEHVEKIKQEYKTTARLGEFTIHEDRKIERVDEEIAIEKADEISNKQSDLEITSTKAIEVPIGAPETPIEVPEGTDDQFKSMLPITISGVTIFQHPQSLTLFVTLLVQSIPVTRRKIPLPGHRNEIFSSEDLCEVIRREKPKGFNPTRSNLEKLGQILLDSRILVGTGFFAKKFNSEGMWFEWSDSTMALTGDKPLVPDSEPATLNIPKFDETWNHMTTNTTKRFNGVFKSMQNTLAKPRFSENDLLECEDNYNEAYSELQKQKHLLEVNILKASQALEHFETSKIELVYKSLADLSKALERVSSAFANQLKSFSHQFVSEFDKPENYSLEFEKGLETFGSGVYFPSLLAPGQSQGNHSKTSSLNTNFQNIKCEVNLFKDIPLQTKVSDYTPEKCLSLHSVPFFLFENLKYLEDFPKLNVAAAWKMPINYQQYWLLKDNLVSGLQKLEPDNFKCTQVSDLVFIDLALKHLKEKDVVCSVNFIKNWLLEISDSIIPSTVHDSIIANYKIMRTENDADQQRLSETLRILGSIPRNNLSSLIYILEHIAQTFELDTLEGFGVTDEIETKEPLKSAMELQTLATELNSVEAIGAIPFMHLIMRPSIVKHASGYRPPLEQYNLLLKDLLSCETRHKLHQALIGSEQAYIKRQEQQKQNLGIHKRHNSRNRSLSENSDRTGNRIEIKVSESSKCQGKAENQVLPQSPTPIKHENFELRPFRTGTTPRPSPSSSPVASAPKSSEGKTTPKSFKPLNLEADKL